MGMKTTNLIFVGSFATTDPCEGDSQAERSSILIGERSDASSLQLVTVTLNDGGDGTMLDDDFGTCDTFSYDLGQGAVTQKTDATLKATALVVDANGDEQEVEVVLVQATNGDLFLSDTQNPGPLDDLEISSVEILGIEGDSYQGWSSVHSVEGSTIAASSSSANLQAAAQPDGTVDGEDFGETMVLGYDDSNAPTDQGGDRITTGHDVIYGNGGDDIIDGDAGNDVIYGDGGFAQSEPISITIIESDAGYNNGLLAYVIDVDTGAISNLTLLAPNVKTEIGTTYLFDAPAGSVIGIGIRSPEGDWLSSGYGANVNLNSDGLVHTGLIEQEPDGAVVLGFEDLSNLGDRDFNDVVIRVDLGTSGTTLDNAHVDYTAPDGPGGTPGNDTIYGGLGRDSLYGNRGDDTIFGEEGDDDLFGNEGDDERDGGSGADGINGGAGDDTIRLGRADDDDPSSPVDSDADVARGGAGQDTFSEVGVDDFVDGGSQGVDYDTLDLRGSKPTDGSLSVTITGPDSDGNGFNGRVNYFDNNGDLLGSSIFRNIENIIPCFTPGTLIATSSGEVPVEDLKVGDKVITRDNGIQEIRWIGYRGMTRNELAIAPHLKPVRIRKGALDFGLPERDMMVSPNHRFLIASDKTALYFEESEVLVAAKHLTQLEGVEIAEVDETIYVHVMFDQHEVILSDGAWSESFQPGDMTLNAMDDEQREELYELFPELRTREGVAAYCSARRSLKKHEARLLLPH